MAQAQDLSTTSYGFIQFSTGPKKVRMMKLGDSQKKSVNSTRDSTIRFKEQVLVVSTSNIEPISPVSYLD